MDEVVKPEEEFQYGGRLFFQTGSSYSSAVNWGMSTKFGLLIAIDLLKTLISINGKLELELSSRGRRLEKSIWRHVSELGGTIWIKFGSCVQNIMRITVIWSRSKPEEEFQYGERVFFQTGNSYISAVNWVILTKCGTLIDIDLLKKATSPNPKPEVKLRHSGRHLENRYDIITPPSMVQFG